MAVTASDINQAIKGKYSGPEWRVWFEVSRSTGYNSGRRADAVVMNIWPSKGFQINVFEVKVSRSDFKNEMADITKSKAIGQYADFFWLACPHGMVDKSEVPENWGLMEFGKGGLRVKKQAPILADPTPIDRGFAASLLRSGEDLIDAEIDRRAEERAVSRIEAARLDAERRHESSMRGEKDRNDRLEKWKTEFESAFGFRPGGYPSGDKIAERIKLAEVLDTGSLKRLAAQAKQIAETIQAIEH